MKRILAFAATVFFAASPALFAQAAVQTDPAQQNIAHRHAPNPHRAAMRMGQALNLSPDQTAKLEPILAARQQKVQSLRSDTTLTDAQRQEQMKAVKQSTRLQMANVLSPEQMQQLKAMHRKHGREQGAGNGA